jgi:hypothetical protein
MRAALGGHQIEPLGNHRVLFDSFSRKRHDRGTVTSERIQRRIERLLDQIDSAEAAGDWDLVVTLASDILDTDEGNREALAY